MSISGYKNTSWMPCWKTFFSIALMLVAVHVVMLAMADSAYAQIPPNTPRGTCSDDPDFKINLGGGEGLVTGIVNMVQTTLNSVSQNMYNKIASNAGYIKAAQAAVILYIAITGILFTAGALSITVADLVIRTTKISIVAIMVGGNSWAFFNTYVVQFFNNGTNEIINFFTNIAVGGTHLGGMPFAPLDYAISKALSAKMWVTLMATYFTGPNGMLVGMLIMSGLGSFIRSVINAMWVFLMAMLLKAFMFGVAPLFIPFILFQRTRHLFDGWLNQIVNACLQPILLFAFFAFFVILVSNCIDNLLYTPVCWTGWHESLRGSPFMQHWWRFTVRDGDTGTMMPYGGIWDFTGPRAAGGTDFPIDLLMALMFLMFAEMAMRFNLVVIEIAKDISGAATNLSGMDSDLQSWFNKFNGSFAEANPQATRQNDPNWKPPSQRPGDMGGAAFGGGGRPPGLGGGSGGFFGSGTRPGAGGAFGPPAGGNGGMFGQNGLFGKGGLFGEGGLFGNAIRQRNAPGVGVRNTPGAPPVGAGGAAPAPAPLPAPAPAPTVTVGGPTAPTGTTMSTTGVSPTSYASATPDKTGGGGPRGVGVDDYRSRMGGSMVGGRGDIA